MPSTRLWFSPLTPDDFEAVHTYAADPEVSRYMDWGPNDPETTRAFLQSVTDRLKDPENNQMEFGVRMLDGGLLIGACAIVLESPSCDQASIGYVLNRLFWGRGLGTEIAGALLKLGFETLGMHRIFATCRPENIGSQRVLEKNGMRREAHFRKHAWMKGRWVDSYLYAILDEEWKAQ